MLHFLSYKHEIYSMGCEGMSLEAFVREAEKKRFRFVIDVCNTEVDRKKLGKMLNARGIEFIAFDDIAPTESLLAIKEKDFGKFRSQYAKFAKKSLQSLMLNMNAGRVCLLGFEKDYKECGRSVVTGMLEKELNVRIKHL